MSLFSPERRLETIDVFKTQLEARSPKVFIENLVLHPVKVTLSFTQTTLPRKIDDTSIAMSISALSYIPTFANMEKVTPLSQLYIYPITHARLSFLWFLMLGCPPSSPSHYPSSPSSCPPLSSSCLLLGDLASELFHRRRRHGIFPFPTLTDRCSIYA